MAHPGGEPHPKATDKTGDVLGGESDRLGHEETLSGHREWPVLDGPRVFRETVGSNLEGARKRAGLSQNALADLCGIDRRTISRIEKAKVDAYGTRLYALAFSLSIPIADLFAGLPDP